MSLEPSREGVPVTTLSWQRTNQHDQVIFTPGLSGIFCALFSTILIDKCKPGRKNSDRLPYATLVEAGLLIDPGTKWRLVLPSRRDKGMKIRSVDLPAKAITVAFRLIHVRMLAD